MQTEATARGQHPQEHFFPSNAISFCIHYVPEPEALSGEDKEDLL